MVLLNTTALDQITQRLTALVLLIWLITPVLFVWGEGASSSLLFHDVRVISNMLTGWPPGVSLFDEWGPF